jgi:hypothetical protein
VVLGCVPDNTAHTARCCPRHGAPPCRRASSCQRVCARHGLGSPGCCGRVAPAGARTPAGRRTAALAVSRLPDTLASLSNATGIARPTLPRARTSMAQTGAVSRQRGRTPGTCTGLADIRWRAAQHWPGDSPTATREMVSVWLAVHGAPASVPAQAHAHRTRPSPASTAARGAHGVSRQMSVHAHIQPAVSKATPGHCASHLPGSRTGLDWASPGDARSCSTTLQSPCLGW